MIAIANNSLLQFPEGIVQHKTSQGSPGFFQEAEGQSKKGGVGALISARGNVCSSLKIFELVCFE